MLYINTIGKKKKGKSACDISAMNYKGKVVLSLMLNRDEDEGDDDDDYEESEGDGAAGSSHVEQIGSDRLQKRSFKNTSGDISVSMFC